MSIETGQVEICSDALDLLGKEGFNSFSERDTKPQAAICERIFQKQVDYMIRRRHWNFATARRLLGTSPSSPEFDFSAEVSYPADCLKLLAVESGGQPVRYRVEAKEGGGKVIRTDSTSIQITFLKQITDPNEFDASFREALVMRLAFKLAMPMTRSETITKTWFEAWKDATREAATHDSQEGTAELLTGRNDLIDAARGAFAGTEGADPRRYGV